MNDLIRYQEQSKSGLEILASSLKEKHLVTKETRITYYHTRQQNLLKYFAEEDDFLLYEDGLMAVMGLHWDNRTL